MAGASASAAMATTRVDDHACAICLQEGFLGQPLRCGHSFCPHCLSQHIKWQRSTKATPACPLCRAEIFKADPAAELPPPPLCAGCQLSLLRLHEPVDVSQPFTCNCCENTIEDRVAWLRCSYCDWDVCNSCCAKLGAQGVADAQRDHACARSSRGKRSLLRRAVASVLLTRRRRRVVADAQTALRARAASPPLAEQPDAEAAEAHAGAAFNVFVLYDRSGDQRDRADRSQEVRSRSHRATALATAHTRRAHTHTLGTLCTGLSLCCCVHCGWCRLRVGQASACANSTRTAECASAPRGGTARDTSPSSPPSSMCSPRCPRSSMRLIGGGSTDKYGRMAAFFSPERAARSGSVIFTSLRAKKGLSHWKVAVLSVRP